MPLISDYNEFVKLNNFCRGKTIERVDADPHSEDDIQIVFTDGSRLRLSTARGIEALSEKGAGRWGSY